MQKKLVIFDLDGTLLDTIDDLYAAVNYTLTAFGYPTRTKEEIVSFVGNGYVPLLDKALPKSICQQQFEDVVATFKTYYATHCCNSTKPFDGMTELVRRLKARGYLLAVVSNKGDEQVKELIRRYFGDVFDVVVGERQGIRKKPYSDSIDETLHVLACAKQDAIYVGDSEVDVQTAKNAGVACLCVDWGFRSKAQLKQAGAEYIISAVAEIEQYV